MKSYICLTCLIIFYSTELEAQDTNPVEYIESYNGPWDIRLPTQDFIRDPFSNSGFWAWSSCGPNEPPAGYPYHTGIIKGLNDTVEVWAQFYNKTESPIILKKKNPQNWLEPAMYRTYSDLQRNIVWLDADDLTYSYSGFSYPDTLYPKREFNLTYYITDIPIGNGVVDLLKTTGAPSGFSMLRNPVGQFWCAEPRDIKDTINAYVAIAQRCFRRGQLTMALSWTDSILAKEDSSLAGWTWRGNIYLKLQNAPSAKVCFERVMSIYTYNNDPLLDWQDTLATSSQEKAWARERYKAAEYCIWTLTTIKKPPYD